MGPDVESESHLRTGGHGRGLSEGVHFQYEVVTEGLSPRLLPYETESESTL